VSELVEERMLCRLLRSAVRPWAPFRLIDAAPRPDVPSGNFQFGASCACAPLKIKCLAVADPRGVNPAAAAFVKSIHRTPEPYGVFLIRSLAVIRAR
jgi:hypothetical protein